MNKATRCYLLAWAAVPLGFSTFIWIAYSRSLAVGTLPFLSPREWKWWAAFAASLVIGTLCVAVARPYSGARWIGRLILYVVVMSISLAGLHLIIACIHGDCL